MGHANKVMISVNDADGRLCVDVFRRPDGSFGFEEFRRDPEDAAGWFPVGGHAGVSFATFEATVEAARAAVPWFEDARGATRGRPRSRVSLPARPS